MAVNPETLVAMKKLIALADKLGKLRDKLMPAFEKNEKALRAAIADKKRHLIQTYSAVLRAHIDQITPTMGDFNLAKVALADVNQDEPFVAARVADIEKLSGRLDDAERDLVGAFQRAKRLENEAEKGLQAALKAEGFELQELASLDHQVQELLTDAKAKSQKAEAINTRATNAAEARNAKVLAAAQAEMKALDVGMLETMHKLAGDAVARVQKKAKSPELAPDLAADLADGANDAAAQLRGATSYVEAVVKVRERVMGLAVVEIDVKKALKLLELDNKFEARLKKALEGPASARAKALEAIARDAKVEKPDGRVMEALLVKNKVIGA